MGAAGRRRSGPPGVEAVLALFAGVGTFTVSAVLAAAPLPHCPNCDPRRPLHPWRSSCRSLLGHCLCGLGWSGERSRLGLVPYKIYGTRPTSLRPILPQFQAQRRRQLWPYIC